MNDGTKWHMKAQEIIIPTSLHELNVQRCDRWHDPAMDDWTLGDWGNALAGEIGELCNVVKKMRRHEAGVSIDYNTPEMQKLREAFAKEVADSLLYLDLLCEKAGMTRPLLLRAMQEKFNMVSVANSWPDLQWDGY